MYWKCSGNVVVSNALHALMSFTICFRMSVSTRAATHFTCGHFLSTTRGWDLSKAPTATRVQKGLRLPALATTSWSRTSSVLTTTDSLPVDTGSGAQAPELTTAQLLLP